MGILMKVVALQMSVMEKIRSLWWAQVFEAWERMRGRFWRERRGTQDDFTMFSGGHSLRMEGMILIYSARKNLEVGDPGLPVFSLVTWVAKGT